MVDTDLLQFLETYVTDKRKTTFKSVLNERTRHFTVVLEDIFQEHNASAVMRSCDVFGIQDVYAIENYTVNKVSRRVAKGSQKWLDLHRYKTGTNNTETCLKELKAKGYQIIATTPHMESCSLSELDITKKSAFVFGGEKNGISDYVKEEADAYVTIPMVGFTESLNISVAAAIILQNITTRLRATNLNWKLTEEEQQKIYFDWVYKSIKNIDQLVTYYKSGKTN